MNKRKCANRFGKQDKFPVGLKAVCSGECAVELGKKEAIKQHEKKEKAKQKELRERKKKLDDGNRGEV